MKIDLHTHSYYSKTRFFTDAFDSPKTIIKYAIKNGLDGLAITDHNTINGSLEALEIAKNMKNFIIIPGTEIKTTDGDILGLWIKENVRSNMSATETIEKIHDLGGIAVAAHPFTGYLKLRSGVGIKASKEKFDAIEVFNSKNSIKNNLKAKELANKFKIPVTAGSDAHIAKLVGYAGIICKSDPLQEILNKKVKIFGKTIPLYYNIKIRTKKMVSIFSSNI